MWVEAERFAIFEEGWMRDNTLLRIRATIPEGAHLEAKTHRPISAQ